MINNNNNNNNNRNENDEQIIEYDIRTKHNRHNQLRMRVNWLIRDGWERRDKQGRIRLVRKYKIEKLFPTLNESQIVESLEDRISRTFDYKSFSKVWNPINLPSARIKSIKRDLRSEERFYYARNWVDPIRESMINNWTEMSTGGGKSCLRD